MRKTGQFHDNKKVQAKRRAYSRTLGRIRDMKTRQMTIEDSMMEREQYVKEVSKVRGKTRVSKKA